MQFVAASLIFIYIYADIHIYLFLGGSEALGRARVPDCQSESNEQK